MASQRGALAVAFLSLFAQGSLGAAKFDRVKSLPGWDAPLKSKTYSGLMHAGKSCVDGGCYSMEMHYVFIESERDPWTDPVVLWTNGGPGAASLFGLFVELGPYKLSDLSLNTKKYNATGVPTLFENPYSWTSFANLLIINGPAPVGFSFCNPPGPMGNGTSCGSWNDTRTAHHNLKFLQSFFKAYPEFSNNDFYLTGESYAGIYVPTLAREVLHFNTDPYPLKRINLKGFAVGDACVGAEVNCGAEGPRSFVEFMRGHGQFSRKTYDQIWGVCTEPEMDSSIEKSSPCQAALDRMDSEIGGYFEYSLYDECWYEDDFVSGQAKFGQSKRRYWSHAPQRPSGMPNTRGKRSQFVGEWTQGYPCGGDHALGTWQRLPEARAALNVYQHSNFFDGDNGAGLVYNTTEPDLRPFYKDVIAKEKLRVLVYVGDGDPSVNSVDAESWTTGLGFEETVVNSVDAESWTTGLGFEETEGWRPWTMDGIERMGGAVTRYKGNFDFLTIRGAGHMVPEYKPWAAHTLMSTWLEGAEWPRYNPKRSRPQTKRGARTPPRGFRASAVAEGA